MNISTITHHDSHYPSSLTKLSDPPQRLFVRGQPLTALPQITVAIVGSRKATSYGQAVTRELAGHLARRGVGIISGLALGIDSIAHQAALEAGGYTLAVMPCGLDRVYPASHRQLAEKISQQGTLISEYEPGIRAAKYHFPARNRIVAALADAVLITEAALRSGTLITAEHALDIGVPVMAVPGPVTHGNSAGTNRLIQQGAALITSYVDVLRELGYTDVLPEHQYEPANQSEGAVLSCLGAEPLRIDQLQQQTGLAIADLQRRLTHLEIQGVIENVGNNHWQRR
jgi:DNA processing protein